MARAALQDVAPRETVTRIGVLIADVTVPH